MDHRGANPTSAPHAAAPKASGQWSTGLCSCCEDPHLCCITWWCPCVTFGRIAEVVDEGRSSCFSTGLIFFCLLCFGCAWRYSCTYRKKLRDLYSLPETPCLDRGVHYCCTPCALSQEYRELRNRGFDPAVGKTNIRPRSIILFFPTIWLGSQRGEKECCCSHSASVCCTRHDTLRIS